MKSLYRNSNLVIIIPLVGILISSVFLMNYRLTGMGASLQIILHGIIMTTGLWLGCLSIVLWSTLFCTTELHLGIKSLCRYQP